MFKNSTSMASQQNLYTQRINEVLNYIRTHVEDDLSLQTLATVAGFSPYHFHRIFTFMTGESLNQAVRRMRLERAAALLKASPTARITDVALACGFSSTSDFSRTFKQYFGLRARDWDRRTPLRPDHKHSKNCEVHEPLVWYADEELAAAQAEFPVTVQAFPACRIAYIRVQNAYEAGRLAAAYDALVDWVTYQLDDWSACTLIGMSQDDPEVTPHAQSSYDICLTLPTAVEVAPTDLVSVRDMPACTLAMVSIVGDIYVVDRAWQYLYKYWLPRSRYLPDNLPAMEIYRKLPHEIGWETFALAGCVPVVDL